MGSLLFLLGCQLCAFAAMQYRRPLRHALWFAIPGWALATAALLKSDLPLADLLRREAVLTLAAIALAGPARSLLRHLDRRSGD